MKIEAGKFYRSRDGRKFGPMANRYSLNNIHPWQVDGLGALWRYDGIGYKGEYPEHDLIAEWTDEPVTGTLKELNVKPGDVVECVDNKCMYSWTKGRKYTVFRVQGTLYCNGVTKEIYDGSCTAKFSSVSRAIQSTTPLSHSTTPPSPVRTVTRKEIVPGVYGTLTVHQCGDYSIAQSTADDLTAAIETLTKIRDALQ